MEDSNNQSKARAASASFFNVESKDCSSCKKRIRKISIKTITETKVFLKLECFLLGVNEIRIIRSTNYQKSKQFKKSENVQERLNNYRFILGTYNLTLIFKLLSYPKIQNNNFQKNQFVQPSYLCNALSELQTDFSFKFNLILSLF